MLHSYYRQVFFKETVVADGKTKSRVRVTVEMTNSDFNEDTCDGHILDAQRTPSMFSQFQLPFFSHERRVQHCFSLRIGKGYLAVDTRPE